jgi:dipeptidyl aminopeptidase/acylaminoacyl peptidase
VAAGGLMERRARRRAFGVATLALLATGCAAVAVDPERPPTAPAPLIPLTTFFADPASTGEYRISPDGRRLGWIGASGDRLTVFFRAVDGGEPGVIDTHTTRSLSTFRWAADSRHILFEQDRDGDGHQHVYVADTERPGAPPRDLTPIGAARAGIHRVIPGDPDHLLVTHNARTRRGFDLVRVDVATGTTVVVAENPGDVVQWITDPTGALRGRVREVGEGARVVEWRAGGDWRAGPRVDLEDSFAVLGFTPDGREAWVLAGHGRDRDALVRLDPRTQRLTVVHEHPRADVETAAVSDATGELLYAAAYPGYQDARIFDGALAGAIRATRGRDRAGVRLLGHDRAGRLGTVEVYTDRGSAFWLVDRERGGRTLLGRSAIAAHADALARMEPVSFPGRDGFTLHGYLTRPRGRERAPGPMVLLVHGGPWRRDYWGYSPTVQFLANRGYAVLQVNYRGSRGYGRRFRAAAVGELGGAMHGDLIDAVEWAVRAGVADRRRVGIMGRGYGGYATLVGMTFTPGVFACGVDLFGPSNLVSFVEGRHPHWTWFSLRPLWHRYAGNPSRPDERRRMTARSPLFRAARVQRPLLIVHGSNDPDVRPEQSGQMVEALRRAGKDVEYVVFGDEGHGGFDRANTVRLFEIVEQFLARHLGGRSGG